MAPPLLHPGQFQRFVLYILHPRRAYDLRRHLGRPAGDLALLPGPGEAGSLLLAHAAQAKSSPPTTLPAFHTSANTLQCIHTSLHFSEQVYQGDIKNGKAPIAKVPIGPTANNPNGVHLAVQMNVNGGFCDADVPYNNWPEPTAAV